VAGLDAENMWWHYLLVFLGAFLFDVVPFPFPPAFTIMIFLQIMFDLNIWWVIVIGVMGSILGRYLLTLYIPLLAGSIFKRSKNEDVQFLGKKMKEKGWKSQIAIVAYSLLPLPTTPLFVAGGMAKVKALEIIPAFFIGKFTSDTITVHLGKYASDHAKSVTAEAFSWKSITSLAVGLLLLSALLFIDWRSLIQKKHFQLKFKIWK
jgi:membrane protein YqaA with SNARE-associated domain